MTSAGAIGTPAFMPPEQARGRLDDVGPQSDLWSVGATMFTLLAGRLVHHAETVNELMLAAMTQQAPPVASVLPSLPPAVAQLIDRALLYDIRARWPNARTMQTALRAAYQTLERATSIGRPSLPFIADPKSFSGVYQAAPAVVRVPEPNVVSHVAMPPPSHVSLPAAYLGAPGATGHPVTMVGASQRKGSGAVPAIVGGLAGALVVGLGIWGLFALRSSSNGPTIATATATEAPTAVSSTTSPEAPAASASAEAPAASASADVEPAASASAAPASKPIPRRGKFLRNPRRNQLLR